MQPRPAALASCRQLLRVVAADWTASIARLQPFFRSTAATPWQAVGPEIPVTLGKSGLAWGRGLHPDQAGRQKQEGDGCAPAGLFAITALFGRDAAERPFAMPWLAAHADLKAIDDPNSRHYNRIVDRRTIAEPDWTSCEDMLRLDDRYAIGAVVAHNADPPEPGAGSCIFLHVWGGPAVPTAGCTAMALADMELLAGWLDGAAQPLLVQLPETEYSGLRDAWRLPATAPTPKGIPGHAAAHRS